MLAIVDTKMDGILDGTNRIVQVTGRVETDVIDIRGQVAQQQIQTQKAQESGWCFPLIFIPDLLLMVGQMTCLCM